MSNRAFQISAVHANGSAINGTVHVERTGRSYSFDYFSDRNDDGAPLVRLYQAGTRPRVVPLNQLRDVRNAVREHFARKPAPPAAPVASDPVPADVPCYLAVSTDGAGVETVMGVFRVAEHASADAAEIEAGKLCERIERAAPGAVCHVRANPDVNAAFADLATAEHTLRNLSADSTVWGSAFDRREAARERAVSLDPVRFVRTYPSQAYAFRHLLPVDMVARIEAAEDDAELRAAVGAPAMVPQPCQPQQGRDILRGMARCEVPGEWQIGIWCVTRQPGGTWEARATGPGTIGDGSPHSYPTLAAAYLGLTGEPMPGASRE